METLLRLLSNRILITAILTWTVSQTIKTVLHAVINHGIDWKRLWGDGGMPSTHSATVTSAATACGILYVLDSAVFALGVLLAFITCHDAMNSRREIGKQAAVIKELAREQESDLDIALKEFVGHTPSQVVAGIVLGLVMGLVVSHL